MVCVLITSQAIFNIHTSTYQVTVLISRGVTSSIISAHATSNNAGYIGLHGDPPAKWQTCMSNETEGLFTNMAHAIQCRDVHSSSGIYLNGSKVGTYSFKIRQVARSGEGRTRTGETRRPRWRRKRGRSRRREWWWVGEE